MWSTSEALQIMCSGCSKASIQQLREQAGVTSSSRDKDSVLCQNKEYLGHLRMQVLGPANTTEKAATKNIPANAPVSIQHLTLTGSSRGED